MILCGIFERKANLSATFLLCGNHIAHMQRERDARERAVVDMEIAHESPGTVPARFRFMSKNSRARGGFLL